MTARIEVTSLAVARLASKALRDPGSLTQAQIRTIAASALTQSLKGIDRPKRRRKSRKAKEA